MLNLYIGVTRQVNQVKVYNKMFTLSKFRMTYKRVGKLQKKISCMNLSFLLVSREYICIHKLCYHEELLCVVIS